MSLGRAAFVRDARVLPIGVPLALGAAALVYSRAAREPRSWRRFGRARRREGRALGAAAATLVGAVAVAYLAARVEWGVRARAGRGGRD